MRRNAALLISGIVTAFVMVLVIGLAGGMNWLTSTAQAAAPATVGQNVTVTGSTGQQGNAQSADPARLQQEVNTYKTQLQQAYDKLQAAYDQISQLQSQQATGLPRQGDRRHGREGGLDQFFGGQGDD
jgi:hypothetical protein